MPVLEGARTCRHGLGTRNLCADTGNHVKSTPGTDTVGRRNSRIQTDENIPQEQNAPSMCVNMISKQQNGGTDSTELLSSKRNIKRQAETVKTNFVKILKQAS